jgi:hypothetical protein
MKTFKEYIQEGLTDKMTPKSEEEIRRTFEEKHDADYYDFEETVEKLKENGVIVKTVYSKSHIITIKMYSITRDNGYGQGWGMGDVVSKKIGEHIAEMLKNCMGEFWVNSTETYKVNSSGGFGNIDISHIDALLILDKIKKLGI